MDLKLISPNEVIEKYKEGQRIFSGLELAKEGLMYDFSNLMLEGIVFEDCQFFAQFHNTNLKNSKFIKCNIKSCIFDNVDFENARLEECNIDGIQIKNCNLIHINVKSLYFQGRTIQTDEFLALTNED